MIRIIPTHYCPNVIQNEDLIEHNSLILLIIIILRKFKSIKNRFSIPSFVFKGFRRSALKRWDTNDTDYKLRIGS